MQTFMTALGLNPELLLTQVVGFLLLMAALNKWMFKPLFAIIDKRQQDIKDAYDQMDADRRKMEEARVEYEKRLAGIEAEARERIQAAVKEAQALRDDMLFDAHKHVEAVLEQGRADTERERERLFRDLRQQIVTIAIDAAGKVIGESLNDARHSRLVDDFISGVVAGKVDAKDGGSIRPSGSNGATKAADQDKSE